MTIKVTHSRAHKKLSLVIGGSFNFNLVQEFRTAYLSIKEPVKEIEVDLSDTSHIDSSGLGMLLNMRNHFDGESVRFTVTNCSNSIKKILLLSRFDKKFAIE